MSFFILVKDANASLYSIHRSINCSLPDRIVIIMGKKSKANRKKAPVATSAATAEVAASAIATAKELEIYTPGNLSNLERLPGEEFPESTFYVEGVSFRRKGNVSKAKKKYLQGIENGCVRSLNAYSMNSTGVCAVT